jgi:hypothetical protein
MDEFCIDVRTFRHMIEKYIQHDAAMENYHSEIMHLAPNGL